MTAISMGAMTSASAAAPTAARQNLVGDYTCELRAGTIGYPPYRCVISRHADGLWLEKTGGSQRFRGTITPTPTGFAFAGTFYCPIGDCTKEVAGDFVRGDDRAYSGALIARNAPGGEPVALRVSPMAPRHAK